MLLIHCPYCDMPRPELEFTHAGAAHILRPANPAEATDTEWAEFLYFRANPKGRTAERWRHLHGCGCFFNVLRDTLTDRIETTYRSGESPPQ